MQFKIFLSSKKSEQQTECRSHEVKRGRLMFCLFQEWQYCMLTLTLLTKNVLCMYSNICKLKHL